MTDGRIEGVRLSPQQRRLWRLRDVSLTVRAEVDLEGPPDREILLAALARAVARHDILRTSFRMIPGLRVPVQDVGEAPSASALEINLEPDLLTLTLPALCGDLRTLRLLLLEAAGEAAAPDPSSLPFNTGSMPSG